tara:strand:+ start:742 stop:2562 length:1821 start_codon:yes stop_codon:yes gene_type:complete
MNFLNRRMFQNGGSVTYANGKTDNISVEDFTQQISVLPDKDLFALSNSVKAGQILFSPELQSILNSVIDRKAIPFTKNMNKQSSISSLKDVGRVAKGLYLPAISGLTRQIFSEEQLENMPGAKSLAEYDSPFYGEGAQGFRDTADRGGRSAEELASILKPTVQDFSEEIAEINEQPIEPAPEEISDVLEPNITAELPEQLPTLIPVTSGEPVGQLYDIGSVGRAEQDARRLAYEKSIIDKDEFGFPLPEGRLLQDETITEALKELQPAELKVNIDKTEADTLLDTQNKFDGKFDPPKITLDKVDTTKTLKDRDTKTIPVIKETSGVFGSDRFLDFIRNVGGELVRTGQMGEGLASGAAKASEERAARELLQQQEDKKYKRDLALAVAVEAAKNAGTDPFTVSEVKTITTEEKELAENIRGFNKSANTLSNLNYVIETLEAGGATGIRGFFGEATDMIEAAIKSDTGESFEDLEPRTRANALLNVLRQANVREILGESGKTISNLDRQIVEDVFGDIKITTPVSISIKKLEDSRVRIVDGMMEQQNKVIAAKSFFDKVGVESNVYNINQPIIDLIKSFSIAEANTYIEDRTAMDQSITDIDYRTPGT